MKKTIGFVFFALFSHSILATDWSQPPIMCPEDIFPKGLACLDLTTVENVYSDFPNSMSPAEVDEWKFQHSADLRLCRNAEVLRRESLKPGTYSPATIQVAWMSVKSAENKEEKLNSIMSSSLKYEIPPHTFLGALRQESLLSELGISPDGGNYSCGIAQLNIQEWCRYMKTLPADQQQGLSWPGSISCDNSQIPTDIIKPFYDIALKRIKGQKPSYRISSEDFKNISFDDVYPLNANHSRFKQKIIFAAADSFIKNCQKSSLSIFAKAYNLRDLYNRYVPTQLKSQEQYPTGVTFKRQCKYAYTGSFYPLNTGWLLSVAMYNAGPNQSKLLEHYFQIGSGNYPHLTPLDLIEALHWGGKWKPGSLHIEYLDQAGKVYSQRWFKSCIVQRHVARVVQHVTLPNYSLAKSLEQAPCSLEAEVPPYRRESSGVK